MEDTLTAPQDKLELQLKYRTNNLNNQRLDEPKLGSPAQSTQVRKMCPHNSCL